MESLSFQAKGARKFLVITVPDLSLTPQVKTLGGATVLAAKRFVLTTNVLLEVELPQFALSHQISIELVDINEIFVPLVYNPRIFGFTNSTGTAFNLTTGVVVSDPNDYVFWDGFHPTTNVHYIGAEFIFKAAFLRQPVGVFSPIYDCSDKGTFNGSRHAGVDNRRLRRFHGFPLCHLTCHCDPASSAY